MTTSKKSLVYLTGFMGSGKTTLAPILANTLGFAHTDTDREVERIAGKTVSEVFRDHGEEYFREIEHRVLEQASKEHHRVVSLGGGTITRPANLSIMKATGITVYLRADAESIFNRMKNKNDRPVLQDSTGERLSETDLRKRITDILAAREPFYNQADIIIDTDDRRVGLTVDSIVHALHGRIE